MDGVDQAKMWKYAPLCSMRSRFHSKIIDRPQMRIKITHHESAASK